MNNAIERIGEFSRRLHVGVGHAIRIGSLLLMIAVAGWVLVTVASEIITHMVMSRNG